MKKFSSILLAMLIIAMNVHAGVAYHYCGGNLAKAKLVIGHGAESCGMEDEKKSDCESQSIFEQNCCEDHLNIIASDDFISLKNNVDFNPLPQFIIKTYSLLSVELNSNPIAILHFKPPTFFDSVLLSVIQVFRI